MAKEIEIKVLNIDKCFIIKQMQVLRARPIQDTLLTIDWYRLKGVILGEDPWYLRIRKYADGKSEVTWKNKVRKLGIARIQKEINFLISEPEKLSELFQEIGLEKYAHQEKYRTSWKLKNWQFDLDQYPNMPAYLEVEGMDEDHIKKALTLLSIEKHETTSEGEYKLIQNKYGLDWCNMRF